jgi:putative DNA primase/helicase
MHGVNPERDLADLADLIDSRRERHHPSEARIAEIFVERHGDEFRYVAKWGSWMRRDGTRWRVEETLLVNDTIATICKELARETTRNSEIRSLLKHSTIVGAEKIARSSRRVASTVEQWDRDPYLLNTPGGTVNLRDGTMRRHDPNDHMTKLTGVTPDAGCPTPVWDAHLDRIFEEDEEMIEYKYRVWGYDLTGDVSEDALFFYYGEGGRGKTTTVELIRAIWGDYAQEAPMEMFMAKQFGHEHPTELTILHAARLVTASENERGSRFSEARVKKLTGGGRIKARKMREDFYEFAPTHKLLFEGNHRPRLSSVGDAWRRRLHMIPFTIKIEDKDKDKDIDKKLRSEAPGILSKIIAGGLEWQREGLNPPQSRAGPASSASREKQGRSISRRSMWVRGASPARPLISVLGFARAREGWNDLGRWREDNRHRRGHGKDAYVLRGRTCPRWSRPRSRCVAIKPLTVQFAPHVDHGNGMGASPT